jgi:1-deoxy-D-xylulose-5-phosphate reductoisomerase
LIGIAVLGATGSIGISTLDVISRHRERFRVIALTANRKVDVLYELCLTHRPKYAGMADETAAAKLEEKLRAQDVDIRVLAGADGLQTVAALPEVDYVMAAIVGAAGLLPTLAAARAGKRVLLANKEALVMSGHLFIKEICRNKAELLPIDSEHNAVFQCLPPGFGVGLDKVGVQGIWLTASGGPFRTTPLEDLKWVTPEQACAHPNWEMGRKISVDSATMMNKGLEVIEACWLFNTQPDRIRVVVHPQSVVHSMVQYNDGSMLAQLANPDMRTPIAYALAWPERMPSGVERLDIVEVSRLEFAPADLKRFPCLDLAYAAMRAGGTTTAILNAANEVAVQAFLEHRLPFTSIPRVIDAALAKVPSHEADSLEVILADDAAGRQTAREQVSLERL